MDPIVLFAVGVALTTFILGLALGARWGRRRAFPYRY